MVAVIVFLTRCAWYLAPMGAANIAPFLVRRVFPRLAVPIDVFVKRPGLFGPHKTLRGILIAPIAGTTVFACQKYLGNDSAIASLGFFPYATETLWFGFFAGFGAIIGDLLRAAVKRRLGIRPGGRFVPFDQMDYLFGGMFFTLGFYQPTWQVVLGTLCTGIFLHILINLVGHQLRLREESL